MRSLAGIWVLPNCSKVSSFNGRLISSSFALRFGSDSPNYVVLKSSPVAAAASVSGSGAQYSGSGGLLDVQTKQKKKKEGIAGIDQDELVEDPKLLADPDSCFCEFSGVEIHHKVYEAQLKVHETESVSSETKTVGLAMILLHGFGASVFSWKRVMKPLAEAIGSKVLAFDRPAFGLTSRGNSVRHLSSGNGESKPVNPYSMAFSVLATLYFIDFLAAEKAIIVGHSAGSLVAVESYFEAPERVAALILVAPAIFAPITTQKVVKGSQPGTNNQTEEDGSNSVDNGNPFVQFSKVLSKFARFISQAILGLVKGMAVMLNSLYKKFLSALLRSAFAMMLVRMAINKFGIAAVRNAWYDSKKVTDEDISGYTKPLRTKGWDKALVEYTAAMLTDTSSESKPPLAKRLRDIKCPVLIVTGDTDRIVPSWNAERLSKAIPGSCFEVIKRCGHLPHEEKVDEFVSVVKKFLQTAFDDSPQEQLQVIV
ncbi:bifunctional epoxide hydrolase 2 [Rosa sericea]